MLSLISVLVILFMSTSISNVKQMNYDDFLKLNISNWKYNRPLDRSRVPDIIHYIKKNHRIEGIIYLAYQKDSNTYYCYDGIHRYHAIKQIYKDQDTFSDILGIYQLDFTIMVDIMEYKDEIIRERFININSSLPVPTVYTEYEQKLDKIKLLEHIFSYICDLYPSFVKSNRKTNVPNINSFIFNEQFSNIIDQHGLYDFEYWKNQMKQFNLFMSNLQIKSTNPKTICYNYIKLTATQKQKCEKYCFYCFASKNWDQYFLYFLSSTNKFE